MGGEFLWYIHAKNRMIPTIDTLTPIRSSWNLANGTLYIWELGRSCNVHVCCTVHILHASHCFFSLRLLFFIKCLHFDIFRSRML